MDQKNAATSGDTDRNSEGIASEGAVLLMTTRMVDAVVRRTFGANARLLLTVSVPVGADLHRFLTYTTMPDRHAVRFLRGLSDAIDARDRPDEQTTLDTQVVVVSCDMPTAAPR